MLHGGSDPLGLACAFRDQLGLSAPYLADLDAIAGAAPALLLYRALADAGLAPMVDAGLRDADDAGPLLDSGASAVVAGLETLAGPGALADLIHRHGPGRIVFSLDLRGGRSLVPEGVSWGAGEPEAIAGVAVRLGVSRLIVLDLARVGGGAGVGTLPLLTTLRVEHPRIEILAGGGVSGRADLVRLREAGASAALVGSALHDGRIGRTRADFG